MDPLRGDHDFLILGRHLQASINARRLPSQNCHVGSKCVEPHVVDRDLINSGRYVWKSEFALVIRSGNHGAGLQLDARAL
jgi:hypothetical protein